MSLLMESGELAFTQAMRLQFASSHCLARDAASCVFPQPRIPTNTVRRLVGSAISEFNCSCSPRSMKRSPATTSGRLPKNNRLGVEERLRCASSLTSRFVSRPVARFSWTPRSMRSLCFFAERLSRNKLASATLSNLSKSLARSINSADTRLRSCSYSFPIVSSHQSGSGSALCTNILKKLSGSRAASSRASSSCASCLTVRRVVSISASAVDSILSFPSP